MKKPFLFSFLPLLSGLLISLISINYSNFHVKAQTMKTTISAISSLFTTTQSSNFAFYGSYPVGNTPRHMALANFNHDGKLDLIVTNNGSTGIKNNVSILLGTGTGSFVNAPNSPIRVGLNSSLYVNPVFVVVSDVDGDNDDDWITANFSDNTITVGLNDGSANFTTNTILISGRSPVSLAVSDINKDQKPDILIACNGYPEKIISMLGTGTGTFSNANIINRTDLTPRSVVMALFDSDNFLDFAVADYVVGTVSIFKGDGQGSFIPLSVINVTQNNFPGTESLTLANVNNDGYFDLVVSIANGSYDGVTILLGTGNGNFSPQTPITFGANKNVGLTSVNDINTDGLLDIIAPIYEYSDSSVNVLFGTGTSFVFSSDSPLRMDNPIPRSPKTALLGDFNQDGKLDLVTCNQNTNDVSVYLQQ
ncbi:MAG: VCBS repeat-containing protein [Blastocatellia bacterium]